MNRAKKLFFRITTPFSPIIGEKKLQTWLNNRLILPLYHAVSFESPSHLKYLYRIKNEAQFKLDIEALLKLAQPVGLAEIIEHSKNNEFFKMPVFHISFDDGLREFYDVAAPILHEKGIPATCFLNNAFIDNKDIFFRFKSSILIEKLHKARTGSEEWKIFHEWVKKNKFPEGYYRKTLKSIRYDKRSLIDDLAADMGVDFRDYLKKEKPYMTSDQIKDLVNKGFTIGAHSLDRPDYSKLSEEEQLQQTQMSVDDICTRFNLNYRVFSFPFTDDGIKTSLFYKLQKDNITDLTFGCAGMKKDSIKTNYQRIPVEIYQETIPGILKKEQMYNKLLKLFGKDKIIRE